MLAELRLPVLGTVCRQELALLWEGWWGWSSGYRQQQE